MTDKNGRIMQEPEHTFSHSMDAIRYGLVSLVKTGDIKQQTEQDVLVAVRAYINPAPAWSTNPLGMKPQEYLELQTSINQYIQADNGNNNSLL